jgi:hypothetical protein
MFVILILLAALMLPVDGISATSSPANHKQQSKSKQCKRHGKKKHKCKKRSKCKNISYIYGGCGKRPKRKLLFPVVVEPVAPKNGCDEAPNACLRASPNTDDDPLCALEKSACEAPLAIREVLIILPDAEDPSEITVCAFIDGAADGELSVQFYAKNGSFNEAFPKEGVVGSRVYCASYNEDSPVQAEEFPPNPRTDEVWAEAKEYITKNSGRFAQTERVTFNIEGPEVQE